jgi:hypothetical protein
MECPEETRLKQAYYAALSAWENFRFLANGVRLIDSRSRLRRELLNARLKAAEDLHDHCISCPQCKIAMLSSFDAVG